MNFKFSEILKAALISAAFLFSLNAEAEDLKLSEIRRNATELMLQKKKNQALLIVRNYIKSENKPKHKDDADELLIELARSFIQREAQEAYENSVNLTLENAKEAIKNSEHCLALEPEQLECLVQKAKLLLLNKKEKDAQGAINEIKALAPNSKYANWLDLVMLKGKPEFKYKTIIKNLPDKSNEESLALILLELDRSFAVKNYSRAKDLIFYLEKYYADWPDLVFYRHKLNLESSEAANEMKYKQEIEPLVIYKNKCKGISKSVVRKFRYDFNLCARGE